MHSRPQSSHPLRILLGLVLALCLALPAFAGIVFTQEIRGEGEAAEFQNMTMRTSIDTGGARMEILASGNPIMVAGS